jgi:RHS repeat-associated protein
MLYSGEQFDSSLGLYNQRTRFYDPGTGRFTTMDTYEGSPQDPQSLHKYTYCTDNPVNYQDPTGHDSLVETLTAVFIIGILAALSLPYLASVWNSGAFPDSAMIGIGVSFSGGNALAISGINLAAIKIFGGNSSQSKLINYAAGNLGSFGNLAFNQSLGTFAGASANFGFERLYTTGDRAYSDWFYFGPGFYISPTGSGGLFNFSITVYAGVCWQVPKNADYSGNFSTFSLGAGAGSLGWTITYFQSDGNPPQNGYNVGVTFSPGKGVSVGISFSDVYYKALDSGGWSNPSDILGVLKWVPGVGYWNTVLSNKWGNRKG